MSGTILLCIAGVFLLALIVFLCIWKIRTRKFQPSKDKTGQQRQLNQDLEDAGFAYDLKNDLFYSVMDCWQREMGYCRLYDESSADFNMIMHCEPVCFSYGGKRWMIELWKGQYGITTGAEIGIYNTASEDIHTKQFTGTYYDCAADEERLDMSFVLRKNGKVLFRRSGIHWWLTGFKLGEFSHLDTLTMDAKIKFPNRTMRDAFVNGLLDLGYHRKEYGVHANTVTVHYTTPHSPQPLSQSTPQGILVQNTNSVNCGLYRQVTGKYTETLDKLEYLKTAMPELYEFCMHSLYARSFYEAFAWLIALIHKGHHPEPGPKPTPCPPPRPCPCHTSCPCPTPCPPPCSCPPPKRPPNRICTPCERPKPQNPCCPCHNSTACGCGEQNTEKGMCR